jgi:hypothetical protein
MACISSTTKFHSYHDDCPNEYLLETKSTVEHGEELVAHLAPHQKMEDSSIMKMNLQRVAATLGLEKGSFDTYAVCIQALRCLLRNDVSVLLFYEFIKAACELELINTSNVDDTKLCVHVPDTYAHKVLLAWYTFMDECSTFSTHGTIIDYFPLQFSNAMRSSVMIEAYSFHESINKILKTMFFQKEHRHNALGNKFILLGVAEYYDWRVSKQVKKWIDTKSITEE